MQYRATSSRRSAPAERLAGSIGIGVAAGIATAAGVAFGRKAVIAARIGKGHPLKHRVLDLAAGAIQPKYPLAAMSTYSTSMASTCTLTRWAGRWRHRISAFTCVMICTSA